jgi:hypothetical protein
MKRARRVRLGLALLDDPLRALLQRVGIPVLQAPAPGEVDGDLVGKRPPRTVLVLGADLDPVFRPRVGAEAYPMGAGPLPAGRPLWPVQLDRRRDVPAIEPDLVVMRVRRAAVVPVIRWRPFSAGIRADCPGQLDAVQDCDRVEVRPSRPSMRWAGEAASSYGISSVRRAGTGRVLVGRVRVCWVTELSPIRVRECMAQLADHFEY